MALTARGQLRAKIIRYLGMGGALWNVSGNKVAPLVGAISNYFRFPTVETRQLVARYRAAFKNAAF